MCFALSYNKNTVNLVQAQPTVFLLYGTALLALIITMVSPFFELPKP